MAYRNAFYYDNRGNLTCVLDPDNGQTYYTYDALSRMISVLSPWGEATYYEYSPVGRLLSRGLGNGCVTYFAYERGQVSQVENLTGDLSVISSFEYERDCMGNPLSVAREDGSVTYYDYDRKYQLTEEIQVDPYGTTLYAWSWDYDPAGNRTVQVFNGETTYYEYNAGNELVTEATGAETTYYYYDHRGNQTVKQEPTGTTYFQYNHQNLLTRIDLPDGTSNQFGYDGDSKRVWVNDIQGARRMIYQGPDMLKLFQEKDVVGQTVAQYTMGMGLESMRRGEASSFYHYDALGSTQELTDATEAVTDTYRYNAWGIVLTRTGSTVNPHAYVGRDRYYDGGLPSFYFVALRYLDGSIGRYCSLDPRRDGTNWFVYAHNSPTYLVDPTGCAPWQYLGKVVTCDPTVLDKSGLPQVFCNSNVDNPHCPRFWRGWTGAFPNVWYDWRTLGDARCPYHRRQANRDMKTFVQCGETITVSKCANGKICTVKVRVIDAGPANDLPSHAFVDLHPGPARYFLECLGETWAGCDAVQIDKVTVSGGS